MSRAEEIIGLFEKIPPKDSADKFSDWVDKQKPLKVDAGKHMKASSSATDWATGGLTKDASKAAKGLAKKTKEKVTHGTTPSKDTTDVVKSVAKKAKDKAFSIKSHIPASPSTKSGPSPVSSIASDPDAAKKAFHTALGATAIGGATYLAARRRKKRREREASYRGSDKY
jgi:hypothetical protein